MEFAIVTRVLSPAVEEILSEPDNRLAYVELLVRHSQGDAGELGEKQTLRNAEVISEWQTDGRGASSSAVRSQFKLNDQVTLFFFTCWELTRVSLVEETRYRGMFADQI